VPGLLKDVLLVVVGGALISVGLIVSTNWRGLGRGYTDWTDLVTRTRASPRDTDERRLRQNRAIFAVVGVFGIALIAGGISGILT
jgi:hypothetical protein